MLWQAVEPLAPDRTRVLSGGAFAHKAPGDTSGLERVLTKAAAKLSESVVPDFLPEDKAICERGQRGAAGDFEPGRLVPMEQVLVDFHHFLGRQLHGVTPPPARPSETVGIARDD